MRILVMGGTVFVGRHFVEAALARGHELTLFNRGKSHAELFPLVEKLRGDRDADLRPLKGRKFDAVFDPSAYKPHQVRGLLAGLDGTVPHYLFISSVSVYRSFPPGRSYGVEAPLAGGNDGYGALKARSEEALATALPGRAAVVRPGLIVGPHDPTDRFTYWPRRVALGGEVLVPGRPERSIQFIDARDLAEWCVRLIEARATGTFNAAGPASVLTMKAFVEICRSVTGGDARWTWASDQALLDAQVAPWSELPLWIPESDPEHGGMMLSDPRPSVAAGLTFRPVADTVRDTFDWENSRMDQRPSARNGAATLARTKEAEVLESLRS